MKQKWRGQNLATDLIVMKSVYLAYFLSVPNIFKIAVLPSVTLARYVDLTLDVCGGDIMLLDGK
jgi:hypothetical protein